MKISEFKIRLINGLNGFVDDYFGSNNIADKFINSTLKVIIKQNSNKFDNMLELFADENGEIDPHTIINEYSNFLTEDGIIIDIRDFIKNDTIKAFLPNKALKIKRDDIINIFSN